jgi:hypothetical protein
MIHEEEGGKQMIGITFEFKELSEDKQRAIFQDDLHDTEPGRKNVDRIISRLKSATMKTEEGTLQMHNIVRPEHTVQVHRDINDTPIPGLEIDFEKLQLSFDWKAMYTRFYGEERHYNQLMATFVEDNKGAADEMKLAMERGEMDMGAVFKRAMDLIGKSNKVSYTKARHDRVSKMMAEEGYKSFKWSEDELLEVRKAVEKLSDQRQYASMEDDSDFDGETGGGGGREYSDDSEDEGWEDADDDDEESEGEVSMTEEDMERLIEQMDDNMGAGVPPTIS